MDCLFRLVDDTEQFLSTWWRRRPGVLNPLFPPVDVLPPATVEALLDDGLLAVPYVELVGADGTVPPDRFCRPRTVLGRRLTNYVDAHQVRRLIREEGATLVLRCVGQWNAGVRRLTDGIAERLDHRVEATYIISPPGPGARRTEPVDADRLTIQIAGETMWQIHGNPPDERPGATPVMLETTVHSGQVLYTPKGFALTALTTGDEPSVHLSLTIADFPTEPLTPTTLFQKLRTSPDGLAPEALTSAARAAVRPISGEG
ncbi:hypothetical protein IU500_07660 [Nocardia terpenica]|uniref:hypothetical protein n=1 Tax=Nocardia terpenica TaxID=455432 RepID=UPI0018961A7C|nr:hypothetical protein [Nocardia terpenica]MBF6060653.1 hypothetical protein [Nocardia terpenica]MBF6103913.1 hypothetical protein [Nocardia terpenica]MBF6111713.1 hypothetical protein [Nocardia terpenica]MBF6118134.1 hypothetical protein [Nocardia terpenica]MBF6156472.1 hypothetical protein [Nocardia terpenica]